MRIIAPNSVRNKSCKKILFGHTSWAQVERKPVQERVGDQLREEEAGREGDHARNGERLPNPHGIPPILPGANRRAAAVLLVGVRLTGPAWAAKDP